MFFSIVGRTSNLFSWFWMALCFSGIEVCKIFFPWYCNCKTVLLFLSQTSILIAMFLHLVSKLMHLKTVYADVMLNANLKGSIVTAVSFPPNRVQ